MIMNIQGYDVLIDEEDFEKVQQNRPWRISNSHGKLYARNYKIVGGKQIQEMMHRIIVNALDDDEIDHRSGNTFDNRKCNLRICSHIENIRNQKRRKNNTSGYKRVYFNKNNQKWRSSIRINYKRINLGCFETPEEAYTAYCKASKKYHGEFGRTI